MRRHWVIGIMVAVAISLSGCAALAPGGTPTPSPTTGGHTTAPPTPTRSVAPSTPAPLPPLPTLPSGTRWSVDGVDFTTPNWMASPAADFGLNLWGGGNTSSLTLEGSATDFMVIYGRAAGASSSGGSLQNLLAQTLSVIQGTISNGPVPGTVRGKRTESFYVQFTTPNGTQDNGMVVYWFSNQADIAMLCGWANSETGVTMQDACRATLESLGATS